MIFYYYNMNIEEIDLSDYDYGLPDDRIAQYPVNERDMAKLLIHSNNNLMKDTFKNISDHIPSDSLLIFNNTRVIRARILFFKGTGAIIEVLCLDPLSPPEYELSFGSEGPVEWNCIIGNLKKWKSGKIVAPFYHNAREFSLTAEKIRAEGETWRVRFSWDCRATCFGDVIEAAGHIPLPPYIKRDDEAEDITRYQTVYSRIKGSVAAPTAGLHFTDKVFEKLRGKGIKTAELTLHVGAGTFQPIKTSNVSDHEMHCEHFIINRETVESLLDNQDKIIGVGTTTTRTLESLYWLGVKLTDIPSLDTTEFKLGQWEAYNLRTDISVKESLNAVLTRLKLENTSNIEASTSLMIVPGYKFRMINGLITNFHQPNSTLLLLISAWLGKKWKKIYRYALENDFRFLSYGDSSLLLR